MKTASHGVAMQRASGHPPFCADAAVQVTLPVQEMEQVARDTFRIRIAAREIAERVIPGQFVVFLRPLRHVVDRCGGHWADTHVGACQRSAGAEKVWEASEERWLCTTSYHGLWGA